MLLARITGRRRFSTAPAWRRGFSGVVLAVTVAAVMVSDAPIMAQAPEPANDVALPSAREGLVAFGVVDQWVRGWKVPAESQAIDPAGTRGAIVTLRLAGRVMGRGVSVTSEKNAVWRAARDAWTEADRAMPFERDALRESNVADAAQRMLIELQLAGELTPLLGETYEAATAALSPGYHGVAARVADRTEAIFPGVALATGAAPSEALRAAVGKLSLPPVELGKLTSGHGLVVYRFEARGLAQLGPGLPPVFCYRAGRILPPSSVTAPALREAASAIAQHLQTHAWPGPEAHGLLGDYQPLTDRYEPLIAPPLGQALTGLALAKYATMPGATANESSAALSTAAEIVRNLTIVGADEVDPLASPLDAAMWLIARRAVEGATEAQPDGQFAGFAEAALARVRGTFDAAGDAWSADAPRSGRGLLACALAIEASRLGAAPDLVAAAHRAVRNLLRDTPQGSLVAELPWLGWAELALHPEGEAPVGTMEVPSELALRALRDATWSFQINDSDAGVEFADMVGGIVFTQGRNPLPTWHTLRPLAFFATALGDARLTDADELRDEAVAIRRSLRFLLQLTIDDSTLYLFRDGERARGGVRSAVWDQACSLEASALGLLCISETLRSSEMRAAQR